METTSYIMLSRQGALRRQMTAVANNLANMNTNGFRGERMLFVDHLVRTKGGESLLREKVAYVRDVASYRVLDEGPMRETGNPLDLAIHGDGYFVIETEQGPRYTRDGHFRLDETGRLVSQAGNPVLGQGDAPIFFAPSDVDIRIARDGTVSADQGDIGRLRIVSFENEHAMQRQAGALYDSADPPVDVDGPDVVQGMVEGSNVQPILEMVRMIDIHRAYQSSKRFVDKEDERIKKLGAALVGQVA